MMSVFRWFLLALESCDESEFAGYVTRYVLIPAVTYNIYNRPK